ncbi:MAG: hypothetical protein CMJ31_05470 [Phycisphaerae bacterium]|nr:hypothetical protein [Phycisphaerae bacterium]
MSIQRIVSIAFLGLAVSTAQLAIAQDGADADDLRFARSLSNAFNQAAEGIEPSVVHITTEATVQPTGRTIFGRQMRLAPQIRSGLGSGVIVSFDGGEPFILTNHHVVDNADKLTVRLYDGRELEAQLLGSDPSTDIAVLRIDASDLRTARLGDSDELSIGDWVLAIGSPFGLDQTVTAGIVSAKGRTLPGGDAQYHEFIQTDASINRGNSGGPLVTLEGEVVGINSAILSRTGESAGIGFAIPANIARAVMESIIDNGMVERGWLGVGMGDLDPVVRRELGLSPDEGVVITSVVRGSPAEKAGIEQGDIVVLANDRAVVGGINRLRNLIGLNAPGERVNLRVLREGNAREVSARLIDTATGERLALGVTTYERLGVVGLAMTPEIASELGYRRYVRGVLVYEVTPGGLADEAGIEPRDIITEVDGREVKTTEELNERLREARRTARIGLARGRLFGYVDIDFD